ncbi:MAG: 2-oxo acid dehydrogenase subunit E2 [Nitrospirae bacterium]|nr:2-oxo acid dehydrogenase subunit E2 [Nitrospirota bacterium]
MPLRWRSDGDYVSDLSLTRRIMPFIMRGRNESIVYFEQKLDVTRTLEFMESFRQRTGLRLTILHLLIWAAVRTIHARPRLNRFTAGGRIYQRRGIWVSFSAKKAMSDSGSLVAIKREIDPSLSLEELARRIESGVTEGRSDRPSATDKELSVLFRLPTYLLALLTRLARYLDRLGLLPSAFIRNDPMFSSIFITNIGSIGMQAPFHHLFEYGNTPIFMMAGEARDEVVVSPDRQPVVRPILTIRYSFDERVEDGLYCLRALEILKGIIENPASG